MEICKVENLTFTYPNKTVKALDGVSLSVSRGEFITLCGKSGCGKTTLLRHLKPALAPHGEIDGRIYFDAKPLENTEPKEQAARIGFVAQSPDNQTVTDKVWHELAFGLESLGYSTHEIRTRVSEMASFFGIGTWFHKNVSELSGGQKQLLNLASVMVMQPDLLILDEPTSQLDPIAAKEFLDTISRINRELGTTVMLSEHRLEDAFALSDRVVVMDEGRVIADSKPEMIGGILKPLRHDMLAALPTQMKVYAAVENGSRCPVTVREGRCWLEEYAKNHPMKPELIPKAKPAGDMTQTVIEIKDAHFRYEKNSPDVLCGLNMKVYKGEFFAVVGGNGAGKTTALSLVGGINKPYRGEVRINGEKLSEVRGLYSGVLGILPQNPQSVFAKKTVYLDLLDVLSEKKLTKAEKDAAVKRMAALCRIEGLLESHPFDLSGGELQRAALAKVLLTSPQILLLDEPTKGLDAHFKEIFANIICGLKASGVTVVAVSHDIEFCAKYADRCAMFFDGIITSLGEPREFFAGNSFYTTAANRMARTTLPKAVLAEDIILACGGKDERDKPDVPPDIPVTVGTAEAKNEQKNEPEKEPEKRQAQKTSEPRQKLSKRTMAAAILILLAIPLTILAGVYLFGDRKYYIISLLVMLETMLPFCMVFERRRPKARELTIISVLCAIAVAGRAAFFMLPQFKPVTALVIIAGVCFGGETGFLVGAITAFVSNFFFGQGPWTPWQMFAFGLIGFIAGILFRKGLLKKSRLALCTFGAAASFLIYGGIMNPSTVIMSQNELNFEMIKAAFITGAPIDLIHAASTAFFLWFLSVPMIEKLERIKLKYGLIEG